MDTRFWLLQLFNGVSYGALLFLLGSGLSLIFGVMRIVNIAHGSYFLLGSYVALTVIWTTGSWHCRRGHWQSASSVWRWSGSFCARSASTCCGRCW